MSARNFWDLCLSAWPRTWSALPSAFVSFVGVADWLEIVEEVVDPRGN